jgi:hypothetical protein
MNWQILFHDDFLPEFNKFNEEVQNELLAIANRLKEKGPRLKRPFVDTLKGSKYNNMKEIRFNADDGVWRVAFAFDPQRNAILLVGGDKSGISQKLFYKTLIKKADSRYQQYLNKL